MCFIANAKSPGLTPRATFRRSAAQINRSISGLLLFFFLFALLGLLFFRLLRAFAFTVTQLDNAAAPAVTVGKTRGDGIAHLFGDRFPQQKCLQLPAGVKI